MELTTEVQKTEDGTVKLTVTVPASEVNRAFEGALKDIAKTIKIKGFREGKAPLKEVERRVDPGELNGRVVNRILPEAYRKAIEKEKLHPICDPHVELKKFARDNEFVFEAETAEAPRVELGNWRDALQNLSEEASIETATTLTEAKHKAKSKEEKKIDTGMVLEVLRKEARVKVPQVAIEEEVARMLARLNDRLDALGLTPEEYLKSRGQTREQLQQEYRNTAQAVLETEFILLKLGEELKIEASDEEVKSAIEAAPDEQTRTSLSQPENKAYVRAIIRKNKIIAELLKIAEGKTSATAAEK